MTGRHNITALTDDRAELIVGEATASDRETANLIRDLFLIRGFRVSIWSMERAGDAPERYQPTADTIEAIGRAFRTAANMARAAAKRTRATGSAAQ